MLSALRQLTARVAVRLSAASKSIPLAAPQRRVPSQQITNPISKRALSGCASGACACAMGGVPSGGSSCGSQMPSDPTSPNPRPVCDPYGNNGKPLSPSQIKLMLPTIDSQWELSSNQRSLTRVFNFRPFLLTDESLRIPGMLPAAGPRAASSFISTIANICINNDHWYYRLEFKPNRCEVLVELKTAVRAGLTNMDFYIALQVDAVYDNMIPARVRQFQASQEDYIREAEEGGETSVDASR